MSIDLERITNPLQLASGSHEAGTGRGCAMNVISWIMGEPQISDFPECSEPMLAAMVQVMNDRAASIPVFDDEGQTSHWLLDPEESVRALDLAWLTVGTAGQPLSVRATWLKRIMARARERFGHDVASAESLRDAQRLLNDGKPNDAISYVADSAYIFVGDYLEEFVEYAILEFRKIAGLDDAAPADPVVVDQAIKKMVTV